MLRRRTRRLVASVVVPVVVVLLALGGCGDDDGARGPGPDCTRIRGAQVTLVAENLTWNTDCLVVDAGTSVEFRVDLRDRSVDHNLALSGPSLRENVKTRLERGPRIQMLDAVFTTAGFNWFVCDIHPQMEGDLYVE